MAIAWRHLLRCRRASVSPFNPIPSNGSDFPPHPRSWSFSSESQPPYAECKGCDDYTICSLKVGIQEFLNCVRGGLEAHVAKIESEIGDFNRLLVTGLLGPKKPGIPCKHRKLILKNTNRHRL